MRLQWKAGLVLFGCLCLLGIFVFGKKTYSLDPMAQDGTYTLETGTFLPEEPSYFRLQVNGNPTAKTGEKIPFLIGNPEENKDDVIVQIYLQETDEKIYQSSLLAPGEREPYGMINRELSAGDYEAIAVFTIIDPNNGIPVGAVETGIQLKIMP